MGWSPSQLAREKRSRIELMWEDLMGQAWKRASLEWGNPSLLLVLHWLGISHMAMPN